MSWAENTSFFSLCSVVRNRGIRNSPTRQIICHRLCTYQLQAPRYPPPPPPRETTGDLTAAVYLGWELWPRGALWGGAHWPTSVCSVIFTCTPNWFNGPSRANILNVPCTGVGCLTISSVPGWGFRIHLTPPWSNPHSLLGGGGVPWGIIDRSIHGQSGNWVAFLFLDT